MIHLEVNKDDRKYVLICDPQSPLGEIHDVLCMMKGEIINRINENQKAEDEAKASK